MPPAALPPLRHKSPPRIPVGPVRVDVRRVPPPEGTSRYAAAVDYLAASTGSRTLERLLVSPGTGGLTEASAILAGLPRRYRVRLVAHAIRARLKRRDWEWEANNFQPEEWALELYARATAALAQ